MRPYPCESKALPDGFSDCVEQLPDDVVYQAFPLGVNWMRASGAVIWSELQKLCALRRLCCPTAVSMLPGEAPIMADGCCADELVPAVGRPARDVVDVQKLMYLDALVDVQSGRTTALPRCRHSPMAGARQRRRNRIRRIAGMGLDDRYYAVTQRDAPFLERCAPMRQPRDHHPGENISRRRRAVTA
jgi:hypothetical protein